MLADEDTMKLQLSIVIVNWNTKELLNQCIESIKKNTEKIQYEIIVVDNASSDGSVSFIKENHPDVQIIENKKNLGFAAANNIGIRKCKGKFICLSNSDIKVLKGSLAHLIEYIEKNTHVGMVGPKTLNADYSIRPNCRKEITLWNVFVESFSLQNVFKKSNIFNDGLMTYFDHNEIKYVDVLPACFIVVRKDTLKDIGLLDENFYFYGEDKDWCKRFKEKNWQIVFLPHAEVIHYAGKSASLAPFKFMIERFKSNQYYWKKHRGRMSMKIYLLLQIILNTNRLIGSLIKIKLDHKWIKTVRENIKIRIECNKWLIKNLIKS